MGKRVFSTWKSTLLTHASPTHTKTRLPTKRKTRNISQQKTKKNKNKAFSYGARLMLWFCRNGIVIMVMLFCFFSGKCSVLGGEEKKARWSLIHASHILRRRRKNIFFGSKVRENNARGQENWKIASPSPQSPSRMHMHCYFSADTRCFFYKKNSGKTRACLPKMIFCIGMGPLFCFGICVQFLWGRV